MSSPTAIGTHIEQAAQALGIWAGGTTRAIYAYPPEAIGALANAQLWVGTAVIDRAAAYSYFPERTRVHVPIHGHGIRLHFRDPAEVIALSTFEQLRFDGARPVQAELVSGPIVAFNLIVQADVAAEVQVLPVDEDRLALDVDRIPAGHTTHTPSVVHVVYAVNGAMAIEVAGQHAVTLHPADAFVFHPRAVAQPLDVNVALRGLAGRADALVATLIY
jgi:environmental stress-induced protein Ves